MPQLPHGYDLLTFDTIDSTNEEARRRAADSDRNLVVWAKRQSAGRGRRGRAWMSEPGNLFVSLLVNPKCDLATASQLSFVSALAVAETIGPLLPKAKVALKWPNDVLVDGAKICGILLEASSAGNQAPDAIIIGIGLNVVSHPEKTPYPATNITAESEEVPPLEGILEALVESFDARLLDWQNDGFSTIRADWLKKAHNLSGAIEVRLDRETLTGTFEDLDEGGALVLQTSTGEKRQITAGDVYFPDAT